ncbi:hypothetical protein [Rhizobium paknamense]|uniref:Uncharacterized protein n=1 Tax=Rhizobium paknamense TaxID=1206817 RepID=A0ABU0I7V9_9HYPH|nr:hypothetical protein [Rhizobium paknamense]MDQ0454319.1 hypothetical protein [Rhizobium paknamense]
MADIVRLKDRLDQRPAKTRPPEPAPARILLFTGVRYIQNSEPLLIGAPSLTGKYPPELHS